MSKAHKKTIFNILVLYLFSTILLVGILAYSYYNHQSNIYSNDEQKSMNEIAKEIYLKLQTFHNQLNNPTIYPKEDRYNSAIFDIDKNLLFSTLEEKKIDFSKSYYKKDDYSYFIYEMKPYYMGSAYIVIEQKTKSIFGNLKQQVFYLSLMVILILILTSYFLAKLIIKPLSDNALLLDRFIKDTTHELNTPVSTILTNIEMLESIELDKKITKKVSRIKMASLSISNLYEDLTFLLLNHKTSSQNEYININEIIKQRIDYFEQLTNAKNLELFLEEKAQLDTIIDKKKIIRVIDNLLSNTVKYSFDSTIVQIVIDKNSLSIKDHGIGMSQDEVKIIFERFSRFTNTQGGFGLGYNIIYTIAKEYNIKIDINSKKNEGTCVTLLF